MSHTLRNPRTKAHHDQLAKRRKIQQQVREIKAENLLYDYNSEDFEN